MLTSSLRCLAARLLMCGLMTAGASAQTVFINEIHYDNAGADTGEAIEIAGPAGISLAGWSLVLYNGSGGAPYGTLALAGVIPNQSNGYGTLFFAATGLQNGSPDAIALVNNLGAVVQFLSYEGTMTAVGGPANGLTSVDIGVSQNGTVAAGNSLQLGGTGQQYADFAWFPVERTASFGAVNVGQTFGTVPPPPPAIGLCNDPATKIHAVQGAGATSPLVGASDVIVEGIVTAALQDPVAGLQGFFMQEEDTDQDGDPATSEGLFVFTGSAPSATVAALRNGDRVRLMGSIAEFNSSGTLLTEMVNVTASKLCGTGTVTPLTVQRPLDWERYEGMLVRLTGPLTVTEVFNLGAFGEVVLSSSGRLSTPTHVVAPGAPAVALQAQNDQARIILDDGSNLARATLFPTRYPAGGLGAAHTLRVGDTLTGTLTAVVDQRFGAYRLHPTDFTSFGFIAANPRTAAPAVVGGTLKVASFNVLNYFSTLDTGSPICGPSANQDCRGANNATEFARQQAKIVAALAAIDADIAGLIELENNAVVSIQSLVDALNVSIGAGTYAFVDTGPIGTDAIKVGLIFKPARVTPVGNFAILDASVDPRADTTLNRPALAQTFAAVGSNQKVTLAVNHFKSKGSDCNAVGDADTGDGQGNCNQTRTRMAQALRDWLGTDPTHAGEPRQLIIGDLNAYAKEDPIAALTAGGFRNLQATLIGTGAYSYVFEGQSGYLDHALANGTLLPLITGITEWHINADEPIALDYNVEWTATINKTAVQVDGYYAPSPYRASDHDPLVIGVNLLCGDLNDDNAVNAADLAVFRASLGKSAGQAGFNRRADFDNDGAVTYRDYQRWYACSLGIPLPQTP